MQDGTSDSDGDAGPAPADATIGARLARAREAAGLSVADVAAQTRIPARHLATIEADGVEDLPAAPYTLGFVRSYARLVGLDPEIASQEYRKRLNAVPASAYVAPEPYAPADPARVPPRWLAFVALAAAILIAVGFAFWRNSGPSGSGAEDPAQLAAASSDTALPPPGSTTSSDAAPLSPAPAATAELVSVTATQPVWLRIYEHAGPTLFQGEMRAGQRFEVPAAAADPRIRTGRPQALTVRVGETEVASLGAADRTIADVPLNAVALRARGSAPLMRASSDAAATPQP